MDAPIPKARSVYPFRPRPVAGWASRFSALAMAAACGALLATGLWLQPATKGVGTHTQMGLPECGWLLAGGIPCPTCGMTTAVSLASHGRLGEAFLIQPAGAILALAAAAGLLACGWVAFTGCTAWKIAWRMRPPGALLKWIAGILSLGWGYKIINAVKW